MRQRASVKAWRERAAKVFAAHQALPLGHFKRDNPVEFRRRERACWHRNAALPVYGVYDITMHAWEVWKAQNQHKRDEARLLKLRARMYPYGEHKAPSIFD